jgi:hypothetical protein
MQKVEALFFVVGAAISTSSGSMLLTAPKKANPFGLGVTKS